jgi:hypothetical protein
VTFKAERILQAWRAAICYRLASSGKDLDAAERWCDAGEAEAVHRRRADGGPCCVR